MTVYGGEETAWGTKKDGFYVVCCKCGWESKIEILSIPVHRGPLSTEKDHAVKFKCHRCGNEHLE
jgi:predicted RNA-binding Zn-ribbon protein involved in translation (DUF1610 family)